VKHGAGRARLLTATLRLTAATGRPMREGSQHCAVSRP